jgi:uncharacterized protein YecT (DUF1311 family)
MQVSAVVCPQGIPMLRQILFVPLMSLGIVGVCNATCADVTQASCRLEKLEAVDHEINAVYTALLPTLPEAAKQSLRAAQRVWIKQRNTACGVDEKLSSDSHWLAALSADSTRAICVMGSSEARLAELRAARNLSLNDVAQLADVHDVTFPISRNSGKWYFEIEVDAQTFASGPPFEMQFGVLGAGMLVGMSADRNFMINKSDRRSTFRLGMAVDLDNGKLNWSQNGVWQNGEAAGASGVPVKTNTDQVIHVRSTGPSISLALHRQYLRINTGQTAFSNPLPAGFQPFYAGASTKDILPQPDWIVPRYLKVQGRSYDDWASAYWSWLFARDPKRNPVQDLTGQYCTDGQSGPVWMLSSGDVQARIERSCSIPHGKYLLLPAVANMLNANGEAADCEKVVREGVPKDGAEMVSGVFVTIDGLNLNAMEDFRIHTPQCTTIANSAGRAQVSNAVFFGIWILLNPLPPGDHVVRFGGNSPVLATARDVTYRLHVE